MENDIIHILVCPDKKYVEHTSIMLTSLFENNRNEKFLIHVFEYNNSIGDNGKTVLNNVFDKYKIVSSFYCLSDELLKGFPCSGPNQMAHLTISTYLRIFVARFLSKDIHKVLYLDGDIIINGSIIELYRFDIGNYTIAAAPDVYMHDVKHLNSLSIPIIYGYFNAGVLLINLDRWRQNNVETSCLDFIKRNPHLLKFYDQDCLNAILFKERTFFNIKYNFQTVFMAPKNRKIEFTYDEEILSASKHPIIIHYTGADKPWYKDCEHPLGYLYIQYRKKTIWANKDLYARKMSLREKLWSFRVWLCHLLIGYSTKMEFETKNII